MYNLIEFDMYSRLAMDNHIGFGKSFQIHDCVYKYVSELNTNTHTHIYFHGLIHEILLFRTIVSVFFLRGENLKHKRTESSICF